uniref:Uncharacterized protein n=1 Tax=Solanum tuberosum TaxID=4113 RepID=M1DKM9_SOLTU
MMAARSVEGNGGSDFNEFVIISLIVADEKIVVTPVPSQYCGSQIKMSNFANRLYISGFVEMDFLVFSRDKDGERWTWTSVMNIPTLGSFVGLGNHNCYLDDIIFLKENENILWRKMDGGFLEYDVRKKETSHSLLTTKKSDDKRGEETIDITPGVEWITRVDIARKAVEIIGKGLNEVDSKFKTLEDFALEENDNIRNKCEGCQHAEYEMKEVITSLECRLLDVLSTIEAIKAEMKSVKEGIKVRGLVSLNKDMEAKVEAPKLPMFKSVRDHPRRDPTSHVFHLV